MKQFILTIIIALFALPCFAFDDKINFDGKTYEVQNKNQNEWIYYLKGENSGNWDTKITVTDFPNTKNKTETAGDYAYKIQSENPGASVLLYPDAATLAYLMLNNGFYEYTTAFYKDKGKNLKRYMFSKRFDAKDSVENARKAAIKFAEENNKKYMEMINKL